MSKEELRFQMNAINLVIVFIARNTNIHDRTAIWDCLSWWPDKHKPFKWFIASSTFLMSSAWLNVKCLTAKNRFISKNSYAINPLNLSSASWIIQVLRSALQDLNPDVYTKVYFIWDEYHFIYELTQRLARQIFTFTRKKIYSSNRVCFIHAQEICVGSECKYLGKYKAFSLQTNQLQDELH